MKKLSLTAVFLFLSFALIFAQEKSEKSTYKQWEIGVNAGVANFAGSTELSNGMNHFNNFKSDMTFGYGFLVKKNFSHVFALEGAYNGTTLTGSPNVNSVSGTMKDFKTGVNEFDLNTVWNMNNLFSKNKFDRKVYWYTKIGAGVTNVKNIDYSNPKTVQGPWRGWTVPLGTGIVFRLSDKVKLNVGTQWSWVNTNSLDGDLQGGLGKDENYLYGQVREQYLYTHAGLSISLGKKPVVVVPPVVEPPKPQPKPEPKPEPKPVPPPPPPVHVTPAVVGQIFKVYFAYDKWDLNAASKTELDRLAKDMQENPSVNLEMKSHTDSRGPASYNMKLSEKRGKSVLDYLTAKGISASRINAQAFGETQPINKCKDGVKCTENEYKLNRRTETLIIE